MKITQDFIPKKTKRRSGLPLKRVVFLVAHDTGNKNTTARNNVDYYIRSANTTEASAHLFVDDKECIECIPAMNSPEKAWHVRYKTPKDNQMFGVDANDCSIGVELCYFSDKKRTLKAYDNYLTVLATLCILYKLDSTNRIVGHHILDPGRKRDPVNALKTIGKTYTDLLVDVNKRYKELTTTKKSTEATIKVGKIKILKAINLWRRGSDNKLSFVRILKPGEVYRVYGYDELHGGQYNVGGGCWITKMDGYVKYEIL
ncbi:MAG: N-acetylmuramoyl-L-alanine amidase CwlA [Bacillales bacterium]|jgi:N-acetylmuramoyl-L-alanine amidase CwlA|nr:N-acetylmuramoyl-L-alanine amidase CwlA [Bacillales bacterium]